MAFGSQWLNDWEDERDETEPPVPPRPPVASAESIREIIVSELSGVLASPWASTVADRIMTRIRSIRP